MMEFRAGECVVSLEAEFSLESGLVFTRTDFTITELSEASIKMISQKNSEWVLGQKTVKILKEDVLKVGHIAYRLQHRDEPTGHARAWVKEVDIQRGCEVILEAFYAKMDAVIHGAVQIQERLGIQRHQLDDLNVVSLADRLVNASAKGEGL